jgi:hypothetical protein
VCKVSEGVRIDKLRRDSSFVIPWRRTQEKVRIGRSFGAEEFFKEKKSTARSRRGRFAKSRRPSDLGEAAWGLTLRRREEPRAIGISAHRDIGGSEVVGLLKNKIASRDFPKKFGPWIPSWTRV